AVVEKRRVRARISTEFGATQIILRIVYIDPNDLVVDALGRGDPIVGPDHLEPLGHARRRQVAASPGVAELEPRGALDDAPLSIGSVMPDPRRASQARAVGVFLRQVSLRIVDERRSREERAVDRDELLVGPVWSPRDTPGHPVIGLEND